MGILRPAVAANGPVITPPFLSSLSSRFTATTLANSCYANMFRSCSKLASIDVSFTVWDPTNATLGWVTDTGTQATGNKTFTCPSTLPKTTGNNYIPSGWTIVEKK